jgi:hypothetical protein
VQRQPFDILREDVGESQADIECVSAHCPLHFFLRHLSDRQHNPGKAIPISPDQRCKQVNRERRRKAETQRAARKVLNIADRAAANLQLVKRSPHMAQVDFARICGTYLPTAAIEHLHPHRSSSTR